MSSFSIAYATFTAGPHDTRDGLERFVRHLDVVRSLLHERDKYYSAKHTLKRDCFHCRPGELLGCTCPTETCECMEKPTHPMHAEAKESMLPRLNKLKRKYRKLLFDYGIQYHQALDISDDEDE